MQYNISPPNSLLSEFVKHYWTMNNCIDKGNEYIHRIIPNGLSELIFYLGSKPESLNKNRSICENTLLTGQLNDYYDIKIKENLSLFSVIFQPYGLSVFFNVPADELFNQNVSLRYLIKDRVNEIEARLSETCTFSGRIAVVENFLMECLRKNNNNCHLNRIKNCIHSINRSAGKTKIDLLASEACLSRKQFERIFTSIIGTSPKQFLKVVRFQSAIFEKSKESNLSLTSLSHKCGYYDQSHMIADFNALSGMTPKDFFKDCVPFSDYFQ